MMKSIKLGVLLFIPIVVMAWVATRVPQIELWLLVGFLAGLLQCRRPRSINKVDAT